MDSPAKVEFAKCWGEKICDRRDWAFNEVFRHQFRIGQDPSAARFENQKLGAFWIEHCPDLPVTPIHNRRGQKIGLCLGVAVDAEGGAYGGQDSAPLIMSGSFEAVERHQARLAGRFALLVQIGDDIRYYPDASSSLTAVMNASAKVIATSVPLAIETPVQPTGGRTFRDVRLKPILSLMGETIDTRVVQLTGNHYVDLTDFTTHRFWPNDDTSFAPSSKPDIPALADRLRAIVAHFAKGYDSTLPLTGGLDSRLLAAALSPETARQIRHFCVYEINWATGFDVTSAKQVASHLNVPLSIKRVLSGDCEAELADLDVKTARAQTALATGYAHPRLHKTVLQAMHVVPDSRLVLRGGAAELTHANKWPLPERIPDHVTPEFGFERLAGQSTADLRHTFGDQTFERYWESYKTWFRDLPEAAQSRAPDVGHAELWLSGPFGSIFHAPRKHFYVNPFNDHRLIYQTMRFDPKMRRAGELLRMLLDRLSPGLADIPYANQLRAAARAA